METPDGTDYAVLAARIDELGRVCARLSRENAELRDRVSRLTSADGSALSRSGGAAPRSGTAAAGLIPATAATAGPREEMRTAREEKLTRRRLGKALGAAAIGVAGAAALVDATARPAAASNGDSITAGNTTTAESATTVQFDGSSGPGVVFLANDTSFTATAASFPAALGGWAGNTVANGIYGYTAIESGYAIVGTNGSGAGTAVAGFSAGGTELVSAVIGTISSDSPGAFTAGVRGVNNGTDGSGIGVWGSQAGSGWGVYGTAVSGIGVNGHSSDGIGVVGSGKVGVSTSGTTIGVSAIGPTAVGGSGTGSAGVGVNGSGSGGSGRGGIFSGAAAQVQLSPGSDATHPKSGARGDLYADSTGRLWFCKKGGKTATWHQVAL